MRTGEASTRRMIVSTVVRSLKTGMTTERSGSDGTARTERSGDIEIKTVPHLLIFSPNWLGDAVMTLPAIADLRRAMPAATIEFAARRQVAPLFALAALVTGAVVLKTGGAARYARQVVRASGADAV